MEFIEKIKFFSQLKRTLRQFFYKYHYWEIDTPIRLKNIIPEAYIDPIESESYCLRTSPECALKKIIASGIEKVFQIAPCFRKEEYSYKHRTEFTLLEWYQPGNMSSILEESKKLLYFLSKKLKKKEGFFQKKWHIISVKQAFELYAPISLEKALKSNLFETILSQEIEKNLGINQVTILNDYPQQYSALSLINSQNKTCQRWEMYLNGMEIANTYSELLCPIANKKKFDSEQAIRQAINKKNYPQDIQFLEMIRNISQNYGGTAWGLERLTMFFLDLKSIEELNIYS